MVDIKQYLIDYGLSDIETDLYLGLLETGPTTILEIAKHTGIKRSTVHLNVENLIQKGLVSQTRHGVRRRIVAEAPEKLGFILEQKKWRIKELESKLPDIVKKIHKKIPETKKESKVGVRYYEGEIGVRSIYQEILKSDKLRSYVNISKIFEVFPENPQLFPQSVDRESLRMWEIIEDSERSREYVKNVGPTKKYRYKFFPKKWTSSVFFDYMIFNGKIAMITCAGIHPSGVVITDKDLYENSKLLFEMMWDLLPEPNS